jgi:pyrroline-5-carboxylate reductase
MKISILGTGNLGSSIASGLLEKNMITQLFLTKKNLSTLNKWEKVPEVKITTNNSNAVKNSDIIIICVQPSQFENLANEIKNYLTDRHTIISTIAGLSINKIEKIFGAKTNIIRAMPNTAISIGKSTTCICNNKYGKYKIELAESIFNSLGETFIINENDMQAATVLCASGIAFWMRLIRSTAQGGVQLGFESNKSLKMSISTALGAVSLLMNNKSHPEQEIDRVTTPGGCTIKGLIEMEHHGLSSALISGLSSSLEKINQISSK